MSNGKLDIYDDKNPTGVLRSKSRKLKEDILVDKIDLA